MFRTMLKSKIHRATVTQADLHYVGSVTVDLDLMEAADLLPGEMVAIVDVTNGARLETYVIEGERGSGVIGINGAAAHLVQPGDLVILIAYGQMDDAEARAYRPRVVFVDADNRVVELGSDAARAPEGSGLVSGAAAAGVGVAGIGVAGVGVGAEGGASVGAEVAALSVGSSETEDATALDALIQAEN